MKIVSFEVRTPVGPVRRLGALLDADQSGRIVDLTAAYAAHLGHEGKEPTPRDYAALRAPPDMIGWLRAGAFGLEAARAALAYAAAHPAATGLDGETLVYRGPEVRLLAPLPRPAAFRDFSIYEEHMSKAIIEPKVGGTKGYVKGAAWYSAPPYYKGSCASIAGPEDAIPWPYYTKLLDLELELGIIVGKGGRNLSVAEAAKHIAGYTILIDSSARDGYEREPFGPTKRKDFHTAIGPCMATADSVDPENLKCSVTVDGETWFEGNTSAPHSFSPAQLVAYASDCETIEPGELLGTGTIGLGCSMDLHKWVKPGQTVRFAMEGIGAMELTVGPVEPGAGHVSGMKGQLVYPG